MLAKVIASFVPAKIPDFQGLPDFRPGGSAYMAPVNGKTRDQWVREIYPSLEPALCPLATKKVNSRSPAAPLCHPLQHEEARAHYSETANIIKD